MHKEATISTSMKTQQIMSQKFCLQKKKKKKRKEKKRKEKNILYLLHDQILTIKSYADSIP
jgi:hypothetical protein